MSKKVHLNIPAPCHEDWDQMTPVEKGKFCGSCQKQVVDFTDMSDREVAMFFKKPSTGSVCGRFMTDQLDRDLEIPKKRIPWFKYVVQFLIPAFFISLKSTAQGKPVVIEQKNQDCIGVDGHFDTIGTVREIRGQIKNEFGEGIPFATVRTTDKAFMVIADSSGNYNIKTYPVNNKIELDISSVGYTDEKITIDINTAATYNRDIILSVNVLENVTIQITCNTVKKGGIRAYYGAVRTVKGETINTKPVTQIIKTTDMQAALFRLYPNPVPKGSTIKIEWKQTETGNHSFQLFNLSGQLVFQKEIYINEKAGLLSVDLPAVTAGTYFIRITNKKSGKPYTEKIIVQ